MATILFQAAGAALGGVFGPVGAIIGRAAGALAGNAVDRALLSNGRTVSGARLSTARIRVRTKAPRSTGFTARRGSAAR